MRDFRNILYAMDLDAEHFSSVVHALEFARLFGSRIHILYVNDPQAGYRYPADHEDAVALKVKKPHPNPCWKAWKSFMPSPKATRPEKSSNMPGKIRST